MRIHRELPAYSENWLGDRMRGSCPSSRNYPSSPSSFLSLARLPCPSPPPPLFATTFRRSSLLFFAIFQRNATSRGETTNEPRRGGEGRGRPISLEIAIEPCTYARNPVSLADIRAGLAIIDDNSVCCIRGSGKVSGKRFLLNCLRFRRAEKERERESLDSTLATRDARANATPSLHFPRK